MKLLMVSGDRALASGKRSAFFNTLEVLKDHFDRIDILCPQITAHGVAEPLPKVYVHPSSSSLWKQPQFIIQKGQELIREHKHDVMTVHEFPPFYNGYGAHKLHKLTGIPYALEIHHIVGFPDAASPTEYIGRKMTEYLIKRDAASAKKVRVVNMEVRTQLIRYGVPPKQIECVPSFYLNADVLKLDPSIKKQYDLVFCARLVPNKGLHFLVDAMRQLGRTTLLVIGDGPERETLQKKIDKWGLTGQIQFVGWLPTQQDVVKALQSAKIFVMNSLSEGGPRIALEAMAVGMPVLSTPVGIMPDTIENKVNGLFTTGKPHDLVNKIELLLNDNVLRERLSTNAQAIINQFERTKAIQAYATFLKSLV